MSESQQSGFTAKLDLLRREVQCLEEINEKKRVLKDKISLLEEQFTDELNIKIV
jgi:hypothetical protein